MDELARINIEDHVGQDDFPSQPAVGDVAMVRAGLIRQLARGVGDFPTSAGVRNNVTSVRTRLPDES